MQPCIVAVNLGAVLDRYLMLQVRTYLIGDVNHKLLYHC
jgi:hypothetical protein